MKLLYYILAILVITGSVFYYGCNDSGKIPEEEKAGLVSIRQNIKLLPLDPTTEGYYNLFLGLTDSLGNPRVIHLGRFNVTAAGSIVDENGNPKELTVPANDTIDIERSLYAVISIDISPVVFPGPTRIVAGPITAYRDSVTARLLMNDTAAVGSPVNSLLSTNSVLYIINAPTGNSGDCSKGVWFCRENGNSSWNLGSALTPGMGWIYQGFLRNRSTGELFSTGRFYDPEQADFDGAGSCADTLGPAYTHPGQDWVKPGCSTVSRIDDGNHEIFITIQPESRSETLPPFAYKIYMQNNIIFNLGCNRIDNVFTQRQNVPDVNLKITR